MKEPPQDQDQDKAVNRLPTPKSWTASRDYYIAGDYYIDSSPALDQLTKSAPGDIQQITASQLKILEQYYNSVLKQASASFTSALTFSGIGVLFFLGAIAFILTYQLQNAAVLSAIIGTIIEAISGLNFWLYGKTTTQLAHFHRSLDQTQRFLLANIAAIGLSDPTKQETIAKLIAKFTEVDTEPANIANIEKQTNSG